MRKRGQSFLMRLRWPDRRTVVAQQAARAYLGAARDYDEIAALLDVLAQRDPLGADAPAPALDARFSATARDIAKLSDRLLVESHTEFVAACEVLAYTPVMHLRPPDVDALASVRAPHGTDTIVVWAPGQLSDDLLVFAIAMQELNMRCVIACGQARTPIGNVEFVPDSDASAANLFDRAAIVVDASAHGVGAALALARLGIPLCISSTSGAHEYLRNVTTFDPWDRESILGAIAAGRGRPAPEFRALPVRPKGPPGERHSEVRITCVLRTFSRPQFLERALRSLDQQTHPNLEIIVVDDAGTPVNEVVAAFPGAALLVNDENLGLSASSNRGLAAATGAYTFFLDDDDIVFPDHVSTLVEAALQANARSVHSAAISEFSDRAAQGYRVRGYAVFLDGVVDPATFHFDDRIAPMTVLTQTALLREIGGFDEAIPSAHDWDLFVRIMQRTPIVCVPRITALYSIRSDASNMTSFAGAHIGDAMQYMIEKYPLPDRPAIDQARAETLRRYRAGGNRPHFPAPALVRP